MSYSATVSYVPIRSSLVNLPASVSSVLFNANIPAQNVVLELKFLKKGIRVKEEHVYVGWTGMTSGKDISGSGDMLEIDPTFANSVGLDMRQKVSITIHANPPQAHTVHLDPITSSDWEIVETHAEFLESWMINQVRAVSKLHPITVYPSGTSVASLAVVKIEPEPTGAFAFAQLSPDSEVVIAPKVAKKATKKSASTNGNGTVGNSKKTPIIPSTLLRGISLPHSTYEDLDDKGKDYIMEVYADPDSVLYPLRGAEYVNVSVIVPATIGQVVGGAGGAGGGGATGGTGTNTAPATSSAASTNGMDSDSNDIPSATSVIAKLVNYTNGPDGHVALSYALSVALGIPNTIGNVIKLEPAVRPLSKVPAKLLIHPISTTSTPNSLKLRSSSQSDANDKKLAQIKEYLLDNGLLTKSGNPITNLLQLPPIDEVLPLGCLIEFDSESIASPWFLTKSSSKLPNIVLDNEIIRGESTVPPKLDVLLHPQRTTRPIVGIDQFLATSNDAARSGNKGTLVYGTRVAGKTSVLRELEASLNEDLVHTIWFQCGIHSEKQIQTLKEMLRKLFLEAAWYSPSVIIFDDLDKLIPAEMEHADTTKTRQLAEVFKQLTESIVSVRNVSVLASSVTKESLHSSLITNHIFEEILHLQSPDKYVRETILNEAIASLGLVKDPSFDILEVAGNTEGYQPGDLWILVERANHETLFERIQAMEDDDEEKEDAAAPLINQSHFDSAMKDFIPSSLRGVKLQKSSVSWSEIGGLRETKNVILETLEWPTRYAPIFANCPLRLRSGLLLYGYPGCGKTLLASAVAAQCGLNFISIKGPEILNKYIGASEQSVRDLFDRAQAAKPCILFFDEFDSIAPKRGHDSTGVTDRVVNQMLTQMDGAEGLDGVYVLAATSRPDLIDSALLRPGRLDKSLICDLPDLEDRLDILKAVQGDMKLSESIDLYEIAKQTDGYSGADLQALLYNAYMEAIHEVVDIDLDSELDDTTTATNVEFFQIDPANTKTNSITNNNRHAAAERAQLSKKLEVIMGSNTTNTTTTTTTTTAASTSSSTNVVILPRHITISLSETKPSISLKERNKLGAIYHQFVSGRSGEMPSGTPSTDIGGRATLM